MNDSSFVIITFYTTADAMATEKICKSKNIEGKAPSPQRIGTVGEFCGGARVSIYLP